MNREQQLEVCNAVLDGKEIQILDESRQDPVWKDVDDSRCNPITNPNRTFRVKPPEWETVYYDWVNSTDNRDTTEAENAFEAGWNEARKRHR